MKFFHFLIFFLYAINLIGQIKNPGFEESVDTTNPPNHWFIKQKSDYTVTLNTTCKHTRRNSFSIKNTSTNDSTVFLPFSQKVEINEVTSIKRISLTVHIKSADIKGTAGLCCQIRDKTKQTGFQNLQIQKTITRETTDWSNYKLKLLLTPHDQKLVLGGYLQGSGTVWYDDFALENDPLLLASPTPVVKKYRAEFTRVIKKSAIYADSLNWSAISAELDDLSKGLKTKEDAHILIQHVLSCLRAAGDNHSFLLSSNDAKENAVKNTDGRMPYGKLLENCIGYIYVPGFSSWSDTASLRFATKIQSIIKELEKENIKGWIVDLRENTGGNMYPMIAGLGPLLDEGTLGNFIRPGKKTSQGWFYEAGKTGAKNSTLLKIKQPYYLKNKTNKVAVLIGSNTASSGEMTAVSFIGQNNVLLFGEKTGGYTTGNRAHKLSDGSYLLIAGSFVSDRNNRIMRGPLQPDVIVDWKNDQKLFPVVINWLLK